MKITVKKENLIQAIQHVSKAISQRTTIPILTGIKVEVNQNGMTLTASDTEITIQSIIPIHIEEVRIIEIEHTGSVVIPSRIFIEIIRKLPSSTVTIEVKENFETFITSGQSVIQIMGLNPEDYPTVTLLQNNEKTISIPSALLKTIIYQTTFATSTSEATPVLTGVLWNITEENITFIACDRHRLAKKKISIQFHKYDDVPQIILSGRTLNELNKILPDNQTNVNIYVDENQIMISMDSVVFYSVIINGSYPDTSKLIPESFQSQIIIKTKEFTEAIERAYLISREDKSNIVKLVMNTDNTIEISTSSQQLGKLNEVIIPSSMSGDLLKISFNSKYMLEALKIMDSELLIIGFTGVMQPIILKPNNNDDMIQLILPYRTTN